MLAHQMQFMIPGTTMQPVVSPCLQEMAHPDLILLCSFNSALWLCLNKWVFVNCPSAAADLSSQPGSRLQCGFELHAIPDPYVTQHGPGTHRNLAQHPCDRPRQPACIVGNCLIRQSKTVANRQAWGKHFDISSVLKGLSGSRLSQPIYSWKTKTKKKSLWRFLHHEIWPDLHLSHNNWQTSICFHVFTEINM